VSAVSLWLCLKLLVDTGCKSYKSGFLLFGASNPMEAVAMKTLGTKLKQMAQKDSWFAWKQLHGL
jgi:hypothetical protein